MAKTKKTKEKKPEEVSFRRIFEIFSVLLVVLMIILIIFAGFYYGFSFLKKNVNANVIASEEYKTDSFFVPVMIVIFIILMIFILVQVLRVYKQIRGIKDDILEQ